MLWNGVGDVAPARASGGCQHFPVEGLGEIGEVAAERKHADDQKESAPSRPRARLRSTRIAAATYPYDDLSRASVQAPRTRTRIQGERMLGNGEGMTPARSQSECSSRRDAPGIWSMPS